MRPSDLGLEPRLPSKLLMERIWVGFEKNGWSTSSSSMVVNASGYFLKTVSASDGILLSYRLCLNL